MTRLVRYHAVSEGVEHWGMNLVFSSIVVGTDGSETASRGGGPGRPSWPGQSSAKLHLVVGVHSSWRPSPCPSGGANVLGPSGRARC